MHAKRRLALLAVGAIAILLVSLNSGGSAVALHRPNANRHLDAPRAPRLQAFHYNVLNDAGNNLCLDANKNGSTAGKNGDKVQLWTCNGGQNQVWIPVNGAGAWGQIESGAWPSKCLNADDSGGLSNGKKVQLWSCDSNGSNATWLFQVSCKIQGNVTPIFLHAGDFALDAKSPWSGNGDGVQMQIWDFNGNANQGWWDPFC